MTQRPHRLTSRRNAVNGNSGHTRTRQQADIIPIERLEFWLEDWLNDGEIAQFSRRTTEGRRLAADRLLDFLHENNEVECGARQLRAYFAWLRNSDAHRNAARGGRRKPLAHNTIATYYERLLTFFAWLGDHGLIEVSPLDELPRISRKQEEIRILSPEQIEQLIRAARRGRHGARDKALLLLLYDTGLRVTEVCELRYQNLDLTGRTAYVLGKGGKHRTVDFSIRTARALYDYLRYRPRDAADPVFLTGKSGSGAGDAMTRDNVRKSFVRWAQRAGLKGVRVSPHTIRHSCATEYMRNGGSEYSLQRMLGHNDLQMTHRYTSLARADSKAEHRRCSPVDRLKLHGD